MKKKKIQWIEVNAKIVTSELSSHSWGTEVTHAKNESQRRVKLTVEIPLPNHQTVLATKKFWILTKNRSIFQVDNVITILYNQAKPTQFKLKYQL